jgi:hypothetical protein
MFVNGLGELRNFLDGRKFLSARPFRSGYFVVISITGLLAFVANSYVAYKLWLTISQHAGLLLGILVGLQIVYQWWRALRYYDVIRRLYSMRLKEEAIDGSPLDAALRIALGGLTDILFYCYGTLLVISIVIGALLKHLERVR